MHQTNVGRSPLLIFVQLNLSCCDPTISSVNFNHVYAAITSSDAPFGISLIFDTKDAIAQLLGRPSRLELIIIYVDFLEGPSLGLSFLI
jgi:hypothetical protein